jgi:hypothetical protein
MSLAFTRIEIPDPQRAALVARSLGSLRTPPGEDWLGRLSARVPGGPWEILLSGPRRYFVGAWETTVVSLERELFRRTVPPEMQNADTVRKLVRGLLWDRVTVAVEDSENDLLARQMEDVAWDVVTRAGCPELEVRLARWPSVWGEVRFVGTVERHDSGDPRVVWCGMVRTPSDLTRALCLALPSAAADAALETAMGVGTSDPRLATTASSLAAQPTSR